MSPEGGSTGPNLNMDVRGYVLIQRLEFPQNRRASGATCTIATVVIAALAGCTSSHDADVPSAAEAGVDARDAREDVADSKAGDVTDVHVPRPGDPCTDRRDCDDGIFCDGMEECIASICISPRNAACRDPGGCASSTCVEASRGCVVDVPAVPLCAVSEICLPDLGCEKPEGCTGDARCDDLRACTDDVCELASGRCLHEPVDGRCPAVGACGIGVCLGDRVTDPSGCGGLPDAGKCKATEGCDSSLACVGLPSHCTSDRDCTDGTFCDGSERCLAGVCQHGAITTCVAVDACHHAICRDRALGDAYCVQQPRIVAGCAKP